MIVCWLPLDKIRRKGYLEAKVGNNGAPVTQWLGFMKRKCEALSLSIILLASLASAEDFIPTIGQSVLYKNPNDRIPPRKATVTKIDDYGYWIDFQEFFPERGATDKQALVTKAAVNWLSLPTAAAPDGHAIQRAAEARKADVSWLIGQWKMVIAGDHSRVGEASNGSLVQITSTYGANAGELTINADKTYRWKDHLGTNSGTWRLATDDENPTAEPGIRLLKASKSEWDFTVCRRAGAGNGLPDSVYIMTSGYNQTGYRITP